MKKLLWGVVGFFVILAAAVIIVPPLIDWNEYRPQIAARVKAATGRDLVIGGDIKIDLLPSPALMVNDLRLANLKGASVPYMVSVKSLRVRLALGPLLAGIFNIQSVKLVEPVIELETLADGRNNFSLEPEAPADKPASGAAPADNGDEGDGGGLSPSIKVENFVIERGTIVYRDRAAGRLERIENLNARLAAASLTGPLESSGSAVVRGLPLSFTVTAGALVEGRTIPYTIDVKIIPGDVKVRISGSVSGLGDSGVPRAKGKLTIGGANLARFLAAIGAIGASGASGALPEILRRPFTAGAQIAFAKQKLTIDKLVVGMAGMKGKGAASVRLVDTAEAQLVLKIGRLDVDKLLAPPARNLGKGAKGGKAAGGKVPGRSPASLDLARSPRTGRGGRAVAFSLPRDINASLNISVGATIWRGALIRDLALNASLANGEVTINQLSASLPGGSDVALFGFLTASGGKPAFEGTLDARTSNLRSVLKWLKIQVPPISRQRLNSFSLVGKVKADAKEVTLSGMEFRLDGTRAKGAATIALRKRLSFGANLSIDRLNLDGYLARPAVRQAEPRKKIAPQAKKPQAKKKAPAETAADPLTSLSILGSFDANLKVRVKSLTLGGLPIKEARFDGTTHNGRLVIRNLGAASVAGLAVQAKGALAGLSPQASPHIEDLSFQVKTENLTRFLKMAGVNYRPRGREPQAFSLSGSVAGNGRVLRVTRLAGKLGTLAFSGKGGVDLTGPRPRIEADITMGTLQLEDFLPAESRAAATRRRKTARSGRTNSRPQSAPGGTGRSSRVWSEEAIDLALLGALDGTVKLRARSVLFDQYRLDDLRLEAKLKDGILDASRISAKLYGGNLNGRLKISSLGPAPAYQAGLTLKGMDLPRAISLLAKQKLKSGKMDLVADLASRGSSQAELVGGLQGTGNLAIRRLDIDARSVQGTALAPVLGLMSSFNQLAGRLGGKRRKGLANLTGSFRLESGIARFDDLKLATNLGSGQAKGTVDLPNWRIDATGQVQLAQNLLVQLLSRTAKTRQILPFSIRGPLDGPNVKLETGKMGGRGIVIPGIDRLRRKPGVGAIINRIFPAKPPLSTSPAATDPNQPPPLSPPPLSPPAPEKKLKPSDILKNLLLKGLGG